MQDITIGIDLGGTRIKAIALDAQGNLLHQSYTPTEDGDDRVWKRRVADAVEGLISKFDRPAVKIGISAPGLPNSDYSAIAYMPDRLQGLENFTWSEYLNHPAYVLNDGVASMVAEAKFGVAKNVKHAVLLTLGTGVGGAILIDGKPYMGVFNKAGHLGHMVIHDEGEQDITGMPGSLEDCIGNCTIIQRTNGKYKSTHELVFAYKAGDTSAIAIWLKSVKQLAMGLASLVNILSPQLIILGGGITEAGNDLFDPLEEYMAQYEWRPGGNKVEIVKAKFGDLAGAIGAASFAMDKKL